MLTMKVSCNSCWVLCVQLEMEFFRVTNIAVRKTFMAKLDDNLNIIITVLSGLGGAKGRKISQELAKCELASIICCLFCYLINASFLIDIIIISAVIVIVLKHCLMILILCFVPLL